MVRSSSYNSGGLTTGDVGQQRQEQVSLTTCAKCDKKIPLGQEVKKGFLWKKNYHKECVG